MKKLLRTLAIILVLLASVPIFYIINGAIDGQGLLMLLRDQTSLRMMVNSMTGMGSPASASADQVPRYSLPEGFNLELYAGALPKARVLRFTPGGDLLLSRPHAGDVLLLRRDQDGDGRPDAIETLIAGLNRPNGMDFAGDWLYIAESNRIGRVRFDSNNGSLAGDYQPLIEGLTDEGSHWKKTIRIGQDDMLYLAQGSTCNYCQETDDRRATMMRFQLDGSEPEIIATGLRNSAGFDWAPWSGELYATDNGRDLLGDDFPPCELNHVEQGRFYGWPYFNGDNVPDPDMGPDPLAEQRQPTAPTHGFRAHNAPLGMTFLDATHLPTQYQRTALVALHGSWNRSERDGYKVVSLHWTDNGIEERDFLTGFNQDGTISGRPVDVAQGPDGAIYISDDYAGAIYRVSYNKGSTRNAQVPLMPTINKLDAQTPAWLAEADLTAMSDRGAALYRRYECASCHKQGENPKLLSGLAQRLGYNAVIDVLESPQSPMPIFPLTTTERREVAAFLLSGNYEQANPTL